MFMVQVELCQSCLWADNRLGFCPERSPLCHGSTITTILLPTGKSFLPTIPHNPNIVGKYWKHILSSGSDTRIVYFVQAILSKHNKLLPLLLSSDAIMVQLICFYDPQSRQQDLKEESICGFALFWHSRFGSDWRPLSL